MGDALNPMVLFDVTGAYAMFRKFYTNSSSLSYPFPPRTTLAGLIAGLMGYERDSYSGDLSLEKCDIAVSVRTPVRRVMQRVNYVLTEKGNVWNKNAAGFDGSRGPIQVPVEWVFPAVGEQSLRYRVYVTHKDIEWISRLSNILQEGSWVYPPYLGMSECIAQVSHVATAEDWELAEMVETVTISTVIPSASISGGPELKDGIQIVKERTPFALDRDRSLLAVGDVLYSRNGLSLDTRIEGSVFKASYEDDGEFLTEFGVFLG
jgi:CRISPR-associated protein Cas5h